MALHIACGQPPLALGRLAAREGIGFNVRRSEFATVLYEALAVHHAALLEPIVVLGDFNDAFHVPEIAFLLGFRDAAFDIRKLSPPTYPSFFDQQRFGHAFGERSQLAYDWIFWAHEWPAFERRPVAPSMS